MKRSLKKYFVVGCSWTDVSKGQNHSKTVRQALMRDLSVSFRVASYSSHHLVIDPLTFVFLIDSYDSCLGVTSTLTYVGTKGPTLVA